MRTTKYQKKSNGWLWWSAVGVVVFILLILMAILLGRATHATIKKSVNNVESVKIVSWKKLTDRQVVALGALVYGKEVPSDKSFDFDSVGGKDSSKIVYVTTTDDKYLIGTTKTANVVSLSVSGRKMNLAPTSGNKGFSYSLPKAYKLFKNSQAFQIALATIKSNGAGKVAKDLSDKELTAISAIVLGHSEEGSGGFFDFTTVNPDYSGHLIQGGSSKDNDLKLGIEGTDGGITIQSDKGQETIYSLGGPGPVGTVAPKLIEFNLQDNINKYYGTSEFKNAMQEIVSSDDLQKQTKEWQTKALALDTQHRAAIILMYGNLLVSGGMPYSEMVSNERIQYLKNFTLLNGQSQALGYPNYPNRQFFTSNEGSAGLGGVNFNAFTRDGDTVTIYNPTVVKNSSIDKTESDLTNSDFEDGGVKTTFSLGDAYRQIVENNLDGGQAQLDKIAGMIQVQ
jgi:hypothetical protein